MVCRKGGSAVKVCVGCGVVHDGARGQVEIALGIVRLMFGVCSGFVWERE